MPHDIFISYSSKDKPTADALCATLERNGLRCWIAPRDVLPGADWSEAIIDAINGSRALVLVYSESANQSPQVRREVERAVNKGIAVVPLRLEDVPMSKALEYFISTPHWLDAMTPPLQRHLDYLADTLKRLVESRPQRKPDDVIPGSNRTAQPAPPAPSAPIVPPPPARGWRTLAVAGGAAAVLIVAAAAYFAGAAGNDAAPAPGPETTTAPPVLPPDGRGPAASLARELVGSWVAQTVVNGLPIAVETTVDASGRTRVTSTFRDQGRYVSDRRRWSMVNTAGVRTAGTFQFLSDGVMSFSGPLGTATWTRDPASPPDPSGRLAGTWSTSGPAPDGLPSKTTLIFAPDGTYQLIARSEESATLAASAGRWRSVSATTGKVTEGTYVFAAPDVLAWTAPTGTLNYNRR